MIDFRYHLVSIVAIFLALAVGLLVGSTFISGYAEEALKGAQHTLSQHNHSLSVQNAALRQQVNFEQAFAQASAERLLDPGGTGVLKGQKVVLIEAPGASGATGVIAALGQAGATVTGQVQLQSQFFDDSAPTESSLTQLAQQNAPQAGVRLSGANVPYPSVQGQQDAAAVIAPAILSKTGGAVLSTSASQAILSGFVHGGYLTITSGSQASASAGSLPPANLAVLLTPDTTPPQQTVSQALVAFSAELKPAGDGTVMAGGLNGIAPGSAIDLENGSMTASTVDNADTESGQIVVALALALLADGKAPQQWGVGPVATPSPPNPTPSPSSVSPSSQPKRKSK